MMATSAHVCEPKPHRFSVESRRAERQPFELVVPLRRVVKILLCIVGSLVVLGTIANYIEFNVAPSPQHRLARLMHRLDMAYEPSIPNWYSSCALFVSSALLLLTGLIKRQQTDRYSRYWLFLAVTFLYLSIDEAVRLHELIHTAMLPLGPWHGLLHFPWVIPASIAVSIFGFCYVPFLRHIPSRTAARFVIAAAVYLSGVIMMNMFTAMNFEKYGEASLSHSFTQDIEESLEMLGIVVFIYALLDHLARSVEVVQVRFATK